MQAKVGMSGKQMRPMFKKGKKLDKEDLAELKKGKKPTAKEEKAETKKSKKK